MSVYCHRRLLALTMHPRKLVQRHGPAFLIGPVQSAFGHQVEGALYIDHVHMLPAVLAGGLDDVTRTGEVAQGAVKDEVSLDVGLSQSVGLASTPAAHEDDKAAIAARLFQLAGQAVPGVGVGHAQGGG